MPGPKPDERDAEQAKNLTVLLQNAVLTGRITASTAKHRVPRIDKRNCEELGHIENQPAPVVNNGVNVALEGGTIWRVTGTCYLSSLRLEPGTVVEPAVGNRLRLLVDGTEVPLGPGIYAGQLTLQIE